MRDQPIIERFKNFCCEHFTVLVKNSKKTRIAVMAVMKLSFIHLLKHNSAQTATFFRAGS